MLWLFACETEQRRVAVYSSTADSARMPEPKIQPKTPVNFTSALTPYATRHPNKKMLESALHHAC